MLTGAPAMKYLDNWSQEEWDNFGEKLANIFGVDYTPTTYEPMIHVPFKTAPWNKGLVGVQPSTRKGTKQGKHTPEHRAKISDGMKRANNSMHNPVHKATHKASLVGRDTPEWREKLRQAALKRWSKSKLT
jgi:hypothetical protein